MTKNNPMKRKEVREKLSATLKRIGHKPPVLGGNGRPPTPSEMKLSKTLGAPWKMQTIVKTGCWRGANGFPSCYKIDLGHEELKLGIEIDGRSHCPLERQAQDVKKEKFLRGRGWTVLRFSNKAVMEHLEDCVLEVKSTISKLKERTLTSPKES
jgi:hypothetical protein